MDGLDDVDWAALQHNYGSAADVPDRLRACAGNDAAAAERAISELDNLIFHQGGGVCPAAPAVLPFLVALARDPGSTVRGRALRLIATIASEATRVAPEWLAMQWPGVLADLAEDLLALLDDPDLEVRREAVYLAGAGGLPAGQAVAALRRRMPTETDLVCQLDLVISLGSAAAGTSAAAEAATELDALAANGPDLQLRLAAVHALAPLGSRTTETGLMIEAVTAADATRWAGSKWLGGPVPALVSGTRGLLDGDLDAGLTYVSGLMQGEGIHREAALAQAAVLLVRWRTAAGPLLPLLGEALSAPEPETRFRAAYLLGCIGTESAMWADTLASLAGDDARCGQRGEARVGDGAVLALARIADARVLEDVRRRLSRGRMGFPVARTLAYAEVFAGSFWLPPIGDVIEAADPDGLALHDAVIARFKKAARKRDLQAAGHLCDLLGRWGPPGGTAVRELRSLLPTTDAGRFPSPQVIQALGRIGPDAAPAAARLMALAQAGSPEAAWALWRVSSQAAEPLEWLTSQITESTPRNGALRFLADFGPLAAASADRLRELLDHRDDWTRAEAAHALYRVTGDPAQAQPVLTAIIKPVADGKLQPVRQRAMQYLADIGTPTAETAAIAESVLANPRRLHYYTGWDAFTQDEQIRATAARLLRTKPEA